MPRIFYVAYQFPNNEASTKAWESIRDVLKDAEDVELSAFNMKLLSNQQWCVALIGKSPSYSRQQQFRNLCAGSVPVQLSDSEVAKLTQRRLQGTQEGSWVVKRHKKPGKYL